MDLFTLAMERNGAHKPLADRVRPENLNEFYGQKHIVGKGKLLRRLIEADNIPSIILYGPPGVGKTTLASIISKETKREFVKVSAVSAGVKELRDSIEKAEELIKFYGKKTIFFIDEIHALKKGAQQDALLDAVEKGIVTLIGATTENPYIVMSSALLSRARVFQLEPLSSEDLLEVLNRILHDKEKGYGRLNIEFKGSSLNNIIELSSGDARSAVTALELVVLSTPKNAEGKIVIDENAVKEAMQKQVVNYDASGDSHYDMASAFIKSIRGSNADAALYYFGRMIIGGEDPRFIVRRLMVHASEDIGMADPNAMLMASAAWNALMTVGMPEARIPIAQAIIYLSKAPKSNSVILAVDRAFEDAKKFQYRVPAHLRDAHYAGAEKLGHVGYKYPHDYPGHYVEQEYFPSEMGNKIYYEEY